MVAYTTEVGFDEFTAAKEQFEKLLGELRSELTRTLEHGDVESLIAREGNELLRCLMQGYLDQRAVAEEALDGVPDTIPGCGRRSLFTHRSARPPCSRSSRN